MRYVIKERFWSWGDDFYLFDDQQQKVFFVDGEAFSWGDKLSFQDLNGNELACISQKLFSWMPTYEINRNGALFAQVKAATILVTTTYRIRFESSIAHLS